MKENFEQESFGLIWNLENMRSYIKVEGEYHEFKIGLVDWILLSYAGISGSI